MAEKFLSRRKFLWSGAIALLVAAFSGTFAWFRSSIRRRPSSNALNVLFITADDLGWKDLSCYGNANVKTPHLDHLASQGIRFDRAFGVSSSCSSSRASFITGQYISNHGVEGLVHRHLGMQLSPNRPTMPSYLQEAGYHTAIHGKWHVSLMPTRLYGYRQNLASILPWARHIKDTGEIESYFRARSEDDRPFYLELNLTDTHRNAKGEFHMQNDFPVDAESIQVPEWMGLPAWPEIRADLALYYSNLLKTDHLVGQTLEALRKNSLEQNTLVVFVSDNGSPYPGNKITLYDRGIGTPLIIRLPERVTANRISKAMVSTIDLMPTILELCKVPVRSSIDGLSFAPLLLDTRIDSHRQQVFAEMKYHVKDAAMRAVRSENWKAIKNLSDTPLGLGDVQDEEWAKRLGQREDQRWLRSRPPFELYDLETDPNETRNLAGSPEVAEVESRLRRQLDEEWR